MSGGRARTVSWRKQKTHYAFRSRTKGQVGGAEQDNGYYEKIKQASFFTIYPFSEKDQKNAALFAGEHFLNLFFLCTPCFQMSTTNRFFLLLGKVGLGVASSCLQQEFWTKP